MSVSPASSPIWDFALAFYGKQGVAEDCLAAQDEHDQIVVALIFALFRQRTARGFDPIAATKCAQSLNQALIAPLRTARRSLKPAPIYLRSQNAEDLRQSIKVCELEAERQTLYALEALGDGASFASGEAAMTAIVAASGTLMTLKLASLLKRLSQAVESA